MGGVVVLVFFCCYFLNSKQQQKKIMEMENLQKLTKTTSKEKVLTPFVDLQKIIKQLKIYEESFPIVKIPPIY